MFLIEGELKTELIKGVAFFVKHHKSLIGAVTHSIIGVGPDLPGNSFSIFYIVYFV